MSKERKDDVIAAFVLLSYVTVIVAVKDLRTDKAVQAGRIKCLDKIKQMINYVKLSNTLDKIHDKLFKMVERYRKKKVSTDKIGQFVYDCNTKELCNMMYLLLLELNHYGESLQDVYNTVHGIISKYTDDVLSDYLDQDFYESGVSIDGRYSDLFADMRSILHEKHYIQFR